MEFTPADLVILGVAGVAAIFGLIGGFSGALAFLVGLGGGAFAARFAWLTSVSWFEADWARALATLAIALVAFGLVRMLIRKVVHGILAQPADALFGALVAAASGFALAVGIVFLLGYANILKVDSNLVSQVLSVAGGR